MTTALATAILEDIARRLARAERRRAPIEPISQQFPDLDVAGAYRIQQSTVDTRLASGDRIVGYKVGLTSRAMQELLGVDQPDYAPILESSVVRDGATVPMTELIQPKVEAEIAFVLAGSLRGPGVTPHDVLAATESVLPALEVIDSRIADWRIGLVDTIADLASSARIVLGTTPVPIVDLDLSRVSVTLSRNGRSQAEGTGAAVLGHPAAAVAWAANTLGALGVTMESGHLVMPGAMHAAATAEAGDEFTAEFDSLGSLGVRFS